MNVDAIKHLVKKISNPSDRFDSLAARKFYNYLSDKKFIQRKFRLRMGYDIDLDNPKTFNEKLQWLKLYDRKPIYSTMVDKYEVKEYVANIIGQEHIIPAYGVWDKYEDIDFELLPNQFVLKCTHDSGGLVIVKDKREMNTHAIRRKICNSLKRNYYLVGREWPYKSVIHRVLAEKYMVDESGIELKDYKVLCFNGEPKLIEYHQGRYTNHQTQDFYDTDWKLLSISQSSNPHYRKNQSAVLRPALLEKMLDYSRILAQGLIHIRIDWYLIEDQLYFGEYTFYDGDGFCAFDDPKDDLLLGSWISLPK